MKKLLVLSMVSVLFSVFCAAPAHTEFKKTKIAVLDFQLQGQGFETMDMGKIVAEWLITAFVKDGRFDVIERTLLEKIIHEQQLGVSGVIDANSAAKLGKVLGARVIISGSVMKIRNTTEVNARIINVQDGSIIAAESVKSEDATSLEPLVVRMASKIIMDFPLEGYIVQRSKKRVIIDLGKSAGVKKGMEFSVFKEGHVIKHPKTGEVLDIERMETGVIRIEDVKEKTASGIIVKEESKNAVAYGQMVKNLAHYEASDEPKDKTGGFEKELNITKPKGEEVLYVGCFKDWAEKDEMTGRDLKGYFSGNDSSMTIDKCISTCKGKGFLYSGVQWSIQCFCGNEYGKYGTADNCSMRCSGNPNQICGGFWANSVYRTR